MITTAFPPHSESTIQGIATSEQWAVLKPLYEAYNAIEAFDIASENSKGISEELESIGSLIWHYNSRFGLIHD